MGVGLVIIDILLDLIEGAFMFVIGFFPTVSFNPVTAFGGALAHVGDLNYFIPIAELAAVILAAVVVFPMFMGVTLFLWLVALIRGGNARG